VPGPQEGHNMKVVLATFVVLGMLLPAAAFANDKTPSSIGTPVPAVNCDVTHYEAHNDPMLYAIPDCWAGFRCGPLQVHTGGTVSFVIVAADIQTTWMGDLNLALQHDQDCNDIADTSVILMCRTGMGDSSCPVPEGCCGCADDMDGVYVFDDGSSGVVLGDPFSTCYGGMAAPGCYKPVKPLSQFAGQSTDGCWRLKAEDGSCGNQAYVNGWTIYFNGPTATMPASWGGVKAMYR